MQQNHLKRLLNVKEAANYLGVSDSSIYRFVEYGLISHRRLPSVPNKNNPSKRGRGKLVFELNDLDSFVEEKSLRKD